MAMNQRTRTCALVIGVLFATVGEVSASNVSLALGDEAVIAAQGASGYKATLDDAAIIWDFSNGTADPVRDPLSRKELPGGLMQVLGFTNATVQAVGPAQVLTTDAVVQTNYRTLTVPGSVQAQAVANVSIWDQGNGALKQVSAPGGLSIDIAKRVDGVAGGGRFSVSGLRVDFEARAVFGDLSGGYEGPNGWVEQPGSNNVRLFTFGSVSGMNGLGLAPGAVGAALAGDAAQLAAQGWGVQSTSQIALGLVGWSEMAGLKITDQAFAYMTNVLDATPGGLGYKSLGELNATDQGWGTLRVGLGLRVTDRPLGDGAGAPWRDTLSSVRLVPEPGTYALMGLGLTGLALVRARRQA